MSMNGRPALRVAACLAWSIAIGWVTVAAAGTGEEVKSPASQVPNSCVACHRKVSSNHIRSWLNSVHARAGIGCKTCHPQFEMITETQAHAARSKAAPSASSPASPHELCGSCHKAEKQAFELSRHHKLAIRNSEQATPTCIDCHTAAGTHILTGDQITTKCKTCHGIGRSAGTAWVSAKALSCLELLRQVALGTALVNERLETMRTAVRRRKQLRERLAALSEDFHGAAAEWHLFSLDEVDGRLRRVLVGLEAMHREMGGP